MNLKKIISISLIILTSPLIIFDLRRFRSVVPAIYRNFYSKIIKIKYQLKEKDFEFITLGTQIEIKKFRERGFLFTNFNKFENYQYILDFLNKKFQFFSSNGYFKKKNYYMNTPDINKCLLNNYVLQNFILQSNIVNKVAGYIGYKPVLYKVFFMHSENEGLISDNSSQFFHSDYEDVRGVKMFLNLSDISNENGPFTFIDKKISKKIFSDTCYSKSGKFLSSKRLSDDFVSKYIERSQWKNNIGKKNTTLMIDTNSCIHYGGRLKKGKRTMVCFFFVRC